MLKTYKVCVNRVTTDFTTLTVNAANPNAAACAAIDKIGADTDAYVWTRADTALELPDLDIMDAVTEIAAA